MKPNELFESALGHLNARASTYDQQGGERNMARIVAIFNLHHDTDITEAQGWHFMQILKDVRLFSADSFHQDSAEDGAAYLALKVEALAKSFPIESSEESGADEQASPVPDILKMTLIAPQLALARMALGLPNEWKTATRNNYAYYEDQISIIHNEEIHWEHMVEKGLALVSHRIGNHIYYKLTRKGAEAALQYGESLGNIDIPCEGGAA